MPDIWELESGTNPLVADADEDPDNDGLTNGQEYLTGTNPQSAQSALRLGWSQSGGNVILEFLAISNHTYTLLYRSALSDVTWLRHTDVPAHPTNRVVSIAESPPGTGRLYRLATPALP